MPDFACKIEGCESKEFYKTQRNRMCKQHIREANKAKMYAKRHANKNKAELSKLKSRIRVLNSN